MRDEWGCWLLVCCSVVLCYFVVVEMKRIRLEKLSHRIIEKGAWFIPLIRILYDTEGGYCAYLSKPSVDTIDPWKLANPISEWNLKSITPKKHFEEKPTYCTVVQRWRTVQYQDRKEAFDCNLGHSAHYHPVYLTSNCRTNWPFRFLINTF